MTERDGPRPSTGRARPTSRPVFISTLDMLLFVTDLEIRKSEKTKQILEIESQSSQFASEQKLLFQTNKMSQ